MVNSVQTQTNFSANDFKKFLAGRHIVLIGMMGAGKSSIGRRLAHALKLRFVDADYEIEKAAGQSIADIFKNHGESAFRDTEKKVIHRILQQKSKVLATGGGAYMNAETRALIQQTAISIWLKADLDVLMARVRRKSTRPLLQNANPDAVMSSLLKEREPHYAQADITVQTNHGPHDNVVNDILSALRTMLNYNTRNR